MSDSYDNAIHELKQEITSRMRTVNDLLKLQGKPPLYPDPDAINSANSTTIRRDQFYGHSLSAAVREFLNIRKSIGPATLDEIYAALTAGSFRFDADESNAKPALKQSLTKNTAIFHRLPNGSYGLAEWYPNRKTVDEEPSQPKNRKPQPKKKDLTVLVRESAESKPGRPVRLISLQDCVRDAIRSMTGEFTKQQVFELVRAKYPEAEADRRRSSIFSMVNGLKKELSLEVTKEGGGSFPSYYRVAAVNGTHK